ncbi:MAG: DUF6573 family protein, partial [Nocardioidaceae bacterium]
MFDNAEVLDTYTLADAIRDGILIDITDTAREAGLGVAITITQDAWDDCVAWTKETENRKGFTGQSQTGRLWDVLTMTRYAAQRTVGTTATVQLFRVPPRGRDIEARYTELHLNIGPGHN